MNLLNICNLNVTVMCYTEIKKEQAMRKRRISIIFITLCMVLMQVAVTYAGATGSLQVELRSESAAAFKDFTVQVWRIADNSATPTPTAEFSGAKVDWNIDFSLTADNSKLTEDLYKYIVKHDIAPIYEQVSDASGNTSFTGLNGIYLVAAQDSKDPARYIFTHFIVPVPYGGNGNIVAAPKGVAPPKPKNDHEHEHQEPTPKPEPPTPPTPPKPDGQTDESSQPTPPSRPHLVPSDNGYVELDDNGVPLGEWHYDNGEWVFDEYPPLSDLPQTGVLYWPVPVLAIGGGLAIALGLALMRKRESE